MLEEWLIDGYNLLHSLKPFGKKHKNISRETLISRLASFASCEERKVLMVLDGQGDDQELKPYQTKNFTVIYSQTLTADSVIERTLFERKGAAIPMRVVTKDRAVCLMARGLGARVMAPDEFMELVGEDKRGSDEILFKEKIKSRGFSRPFDEKLKSLSQKFDSPSKNKSQDQTQK
jgi:predicted RNA-binding protein with PIN domain